MTYEITLILGVILVGVTLVALMLRKLIWSLILLFYSSIMFGILLMTFGATFAGLFHIITFAGALSVLFMVIMMIVGEQTVTTRQFGRENYVGILLALLVALPLIIIVSNFQSFPSRINEQEQLAGLLIQPDGALGFLWIMRSWDMLLLVILIAAAMLGVMNLFSREGRHEK
jgi:NADH:ubiquinone oxidoreductase subunit 6 (subunit J)